MIRGELLPGARWDGIGPLDDLANACRRFPQRTFLRWRGGSWTFAQFAGQARRCASTLQSAGVEPGDRVGLMSRNCPELVAWQFGVYMVGAVEVAINAELRGPILSHVIDDSEPDLVIASTEAANSLQQFSARRMRILIMGEMDLLEDVDARVNSSEATIDIDWQIPPSGQLATILYTSGTTGPSKGVMLSHGYFSNLGSVMAAVLDLDENDVGYFVLPFFHVDAHVIIISVLESGSVLSFTERFSVSRFWSDVTEFGASWSFLIGSVLAAVMNRGELPEPSRQPLRKILGAPFPEATVDFFQDKLGIDMLCMFGQTEADGPCFETTDRRRRGSAGWACAGFDIGILDVEGHSVPSGTIGEIVYRPQGPNRMSIGYWRSSEATIEAWRDLWFHTGDLGSIDEDGFLFFRGRLKDSLRRRGENVSVWELEQTIRQAPGILDCAAIGLVDDLGGEDEIKVLVSLKETHLGNFDPDAFLQFCVENLPRFAVPRFIEVFPDTGFVRSVGTGVIQKHRLPRENGPATLDRHIIDPASAPSPKEIRTT